MVFLCPSQKYIRKKIEIIAVFQSGEVTGSRLKSIFGIHPVTVCRWVTRLNPMALQNSKKEQIKLITQRNLRFNFAEKTSA